MKLRYKLSIGVVVIAGVFLLRNCGQRIAKPGVLRPDTKEQIIIDPRNRRIQIVTENGVKQTTLPDRPSTIDILKDGTVKVNAPQIGWETSPFIGVGYALSGGQLLGGVDLAYWKKLDLGVGVAMNPTYVQDARLFVGVSYCFYSNTSLMLGIDNKQMPLIGIKVRL